MSISVDVPPTLHEVQQAGFPMGGEPLVAVDLADTVMLAAEPPLDLLAGPGAATDPVTIWWRLQERRLPAGPVPDAASTRRLRDAIRDLFDAHLERRSPCATSIEDVNAAAAAVPTSVRFVADGSVPGTALRSEVRWHTEHGGNARLAAIAREVIDLMSDPERLARLRRCANPECSMLFLAENARRQWCTANICGNRARVARHYQRRRNAPGASTSTD